MKRIRRIGVLQTSKVVAIIYFLIAAVLVLPIGIMSTWFGTDTIPALPFGGGMFFMFVPLVYGIAGFITTAFSCLVYNVIAKYTGGIEFDVEIVQSHSDMSL